jgi:histone deacetylase 11
MQAMSWALAIGSLGFIRNIHPFIGDRSRRVRDFLVASGRFACQDFIAPEMNEELILSYLQPQYREIVHNKLLVAGAVEIFTLQFLPYSFLRYHLLEPMLLASCGTIKTVELAMQEKLAINLGGGFHHASFYSGGGFCLYPDMPIAMKEIRKQYPGLKIAVLDCDAHQGNGTERALDENDSTFMVDMFNCQIYPQDSDAEKVADVAVRLNFGCRDQVYLQALQTIALPAIEKFAPQLIIYGAGTDIYEKDPLGGMNVSAQGIMQRDKLVKDFACQHDIPLAMVLSGGYHIDSGRIIADSILNNFVL